MGQRGEKIVWLVAVLSLCEGYQHQHHQRGKLVKRSALIDPELVTRIEVDALSAFVGGAVGVIGTLIAYEQRRYHARTRVACPYCQGAGSLTCGACAGVGTLRGGDECPTCSGTGRIKCVNCEATGLSIPPQLERKTEAMIDDELETKLDQIGIAALADDMLRAEARPEDINLLNKLIQRRASVVSKNSKANKSKSLSS